MNWLALIPSLVSLVVEIPALVKTWNTSTTNGMAAVDEILQKSGGVIKILADIGAQLFPKLDPTLHAAAAALVIAHPNNTSWAQSALNVVAASGYIKLAAPLKVDGYWGPRTMAAVEALQAKLGLPVNGFLADLEYNALAGLLAKV